MTLIIVGVVRPMVSWNGIARGLSSPVGAASGNIDVQVVRAEKTEGVRAKSGWHLAIESGWKQYALAASVISGVAVANVALNQFTGPRIPGFVFLVTVVIVALFLGRGPVFSAGAFSALVWDYFFLPPRFTFIISSAEDAVLFGAYFLICAASGTFRGPNRTQEQAERRASSASVVLANA